MYIVHNTTKSLSLSSLDTTKEMDDDLADSRQSFVNYRL